MRSFFIGACVLVSGACAAPVDDVASERAPLVLTSSVSAEAALADLPAGCEDQLGSDDVVLEVLPEVPDLAVARVDGAATCVDAVAALIEDLTAGDEEAEEIALSRYAAARAESSEEGAGPDLHDTTGAPAPETGAEAAAEAAGGDPHPVPMDRGEGVETEARPSQAAEGDPHPVPMDAAPVDVGDAAQGDPHPVPMDAAPMDQPGGAAQGDPHPVPMDAAPMDAAPTAPPGDAAQGDPHPVPMDQPGDAAQGDPHPVPMNGAPVDREGTPADAPAGGPLPGDATKGDPHPVPMAPGPEATADTAAI